MHGNLPTSDEAKAVAERLLHVTGAALMSGDFDTFAAALHLPHEMTTDDDRFTIRSPAELEVIFDNVRKSFAKDRVTQLDRRVEAAMFRSSDQITSTHVTRRMAGNTQVGPETPTLSTLERIGGDWKVTAANYALADQLDHALALSPSRASKTAATGIYQRFVDQLSEAILKRDPAKLVALLHLPLQIMTETDSANANDIAEISYHFDQLAASYAQLGIDGSTRIVKDAQFVSHNEVIGAHETHLTKNGKRVIPPYPTRLRLKQVDDKTWKATQMSIGVRNTFSTLTRVVQVAPNPQAPDLDTNDKGLRK